MLAKLGQLTTVQRALLLLCLPVMLVSLLLIRAANDVQVATAPVPKEVSDTSFAKKLEKQADASSSKRATKAEVRAKREVHRRQATPRARAERRRSRTAYKNLSSQEARAAVSKEQPRIIKDTAWKAPELQPGAKILGYADSKTARIDMPGKAPDAFVSSTVEPIAVPTSDGKLKPIDLQLRKSAGGLSPERSRVPLLLPERASDGIKFGDKKSDQIVLSLGESESRAAVVGDDKKMFYANTQVDTDTIIEALPLGAEVSWTLRSPASPASLPMDFKGPASNFKLMVDGGASFDAGPLGDGVVGTPVAWDAQGRTVNTKLVVTERGVSVEVDHRNAEVAYPVVVDPAVNYGGNAIRENAGYDIYGTAKPLTNDNTLTPFSYQTSSPYRVAYGSYAEATGYVLFLRVTAGSTGNHHANLVYDAPRNSSIFRVTFHNVKHQYPKDTKLRIGLMSAGAQWESQQVTYSGAGWSAGTYFESAGWMDAATTVEACATGTCGIGGSQDNKAVFQFLYNQVGSSPSGSNLPTAQTRGAYIYFADNTAPSLDFGNFQNMPATGWGKNSPSPKFDAIVQDTGVGVGNAAQLDSGGFYSHHASAFDSKIDGVSALPAALRSGVGPICHGGVAGICPLRFDYNNYSVPLQDGKHKYELQGADIVGNTTTHTYEIRTDRSGPEIDLSGRLGAFALDSAALGSGDPRTIVEDAPFVIAASDGRRKLPNGADASSKEHRSGVKSISAQIWATNNGIPTTVVNDLDAPNGPKLSNPVDCDPARAGNNPDVNNSCSLSYGGTFNAETLPPGIYVFRVEAWDYVGNKTTKDFRVAVGIASMNTVVEGDASARYVPIQVKRNAGNTATEATIQYRTGVNQPWCNLDSANNGSAAALSTQDEPTVPVVDDVSIGSNGLSGNYVLDLDDLRTFTSGCTSPANRLADGKVYIRALLAGTDHPSMRSAEDVTVRYEHGGLGTSNATAAIGPGSVDLVTGNFSMSATDVSIDAYKSDLTVSRTYNSRYYGQIGPLGPGWKFGIESESAGSSFVGVLDNTDVGIPDGERYPTVDVMTVGGDFLAFELTATPNKYRAENGAESLELVRIPDAADATRSAGFKIHDHDSGTVTSFKPMSSPAIAGEYEVDEVFQPGASDQITYAYASHAAIGTVVSHAFAPAAGLTCRATDASAGESFDNLPQGCQALKFNYSTLAAGVRLTSIQLKTWDPAVSGMKTTTVAAYGYDGGGRLIKQWDPRISPALETTYTVLNDSRVASVAPPGEAPFYINYLKLPEDPGYGRLDNVQRTPTGGTTATWTARFYVPTHGSGAPFDFSATEVAKWGQDHPPFIGAAMFPPDQPPNGSPATNYDRASMTYMDPLGRAINTREPGNRIATTEYNKWGEVERTLGAENRARALAESTPAARIAAAEKWDTRNEYESVDGSPSGRRHLTRTLGPEHQIRLDDGTWVQARTVNDYTYDEASPIAGDNTKEPFDLVTAEKQSALFDGQLHDTRTTKTAYGTTEAEWKLRIPRLVTTDPDGLKIKQKTTVDADGNVTERFQPKSQEPNQTVPDSDQPTTTHFVYYTAGTNDQAEECGDSPEWMGLVCRQGPGTQPTTAGLPGLPVKTITYNYLRQPLVSSESVVDASGSTKTRTTTITYDEAGRPLTEEITGNVGTALSKVSHVYNTSTGRETQTKTVSGAQTLKTITRAFDSLGRQTNYTDAEGHASSVTYDILSRPSTITNEKSTRTNTYEPLTGDLTYVSDSAAGGFVGVYDADARLIATGMPGGVNKWFTYDTAGSPTYVGYTRSDGSLLYQNAGLENAHGQYVGLLEDISGQDSGLQYYDYDAAGRLTKVQDNRAGTHCTQREYTLDANSNRLSKVARPESAGYCAQSGGTPTLNTYDDADRMTNDDYEYDAFGRITSAPGADTGGTSAFTASYYVNDLARSITQDGTTQTLDLDPMMRMSVKTTTSSGPTTTESYAYDGDSDSPAFTQKGAAWNRTVAGVGGADAVHDSASGVKLLIQNLRGDVVAQSTTAGVLGTATRVDEFGVPKAALPAGTKYAFHGSKQREALTAGGMIAMGVRLYQPQAGRFLQVDPVLGGTANPYEYPSDPVNGADLDGRFTMKRQVFSRGVALKLLNWMRRFNTFEKGVKGLALGVACSTAAVAAGAPTAGTLALVVTTLCGTVSAISPFLVHTMLNKQIKGLKKAIGRSREYGTGRVIARFGLTAKGTFPMRSAGKFWAHWYPEYANGGGGGGW